jgi:hypothetical protein
VPTLLQKLPSFQNKRQVIVHNQAVGDIITGILRTHSMYAKDYDRIADQFAGRNAEAIAKKVYDYLKTNTHYKIEPDTQQTLRSPSAILALGANPRVGLDCKSYSLFIAGILSAWQRKGMKINWCYRFASYKLLDKLPHHVFICLNPNTDKEIWVDPVLPTFNNRKQFTYKIDKKPMALVAVAGIGKVKRTRAEKIERRKQLKSKIKDKIKKAGKVVLKFNPATAAARNAFLLLVKVNALKLGSKLYLAQQKDAAKLKKFWETIGGNYRTLSINIGLGAKKKPQFAGFDNSIGDPVLATAAATAVPILLKVEQYLKKLGITTDDVKKYATKAVKQIVEKKLNAKADEIAASEEGETPIDQQSADDMNIPKEAEQALDSETRSKESGSEESGSDSGDGVGGLSTNTIIIGGAALAAAYFLTRKK